MRDCSRPSPLRAATGAAVVAAAAADVAAGAPAQLPGTGGTGDYGDDDDETPPAEERMEGGISDCDGLLRFEASLEQPVEGRLIRQGDLLMLDGEENRMKQWTVLLFSNGFYTVPRSGGELQSFAWSPFSEVREVTPIPEDKHSPFGAFPAFTLYLFSQNLGFVFAAWGEGAMAERRRWVAAMAGALQSFTRSLFPPFSIAALPLRHLPGTATRILAGYLLREDGGSVVAAPYCELHAHSQGAALFAMYESECCDRLESSIALTAATPVLDRERAQSGCFSLDGIHFCARSLQEKHLWMRALRNVKVKLLNEAPDPSAEDLQHWRVSVLERAATVAAEMELEASRCVGVQGTCSGHPATPFSHLRRPLPCLRTAAAAAAMTTAPQGPAMSARSGGSRRSSRSDSTEGGKADQVAAKPTAAAGPPPQDQPPPPCCEGAGDKEGTVGLVPGRAPALAARVAPKQDLEPAPRGPPASSSLGLGLPLRHSGGARSGLGSGSNALPPAGAPWPLPPGGVASKFAAPCGGAGGPVAPTCTDPITPDALWELNTLGGLSGGLSSTGGVGCSSAREATICTQPVRAI